MPKFSVGDTITDGITTVVIDAVDTLAGEYSFSLKDGTNHRNKIDLIDKGCKLIAAKGYAKLVPGYIAKYNGIDYLAKGGLGTGESGEIVTNHGYTATVSIRGMNWSVSNPDDWDVLGANPKPIPGAVRVVMPTHPIGLVNKPKGMVEHRACSCDSLELMRKGCLCGAITKGKWGIGA